MEVISVTFDNKYIIGMAIAIFRIGLYMLMLIISFILKIKVGDKM